MERIITKRQLRTNNAEIIRALGDGDSFVITLNGIPWARLTPAPLPTVSRKSFRRDVGELAALLERITAENVHGLNTI